MIYIDQGLDIDTDTVNKKCLTIMMLICIKQHLSNIWSSIHNKVKQHQHWVAKKLASNKAVPQCNDVSKVFVRSQIFFKITKYLNITRPNFLLPKNRRNKGQSRSYTLDFAENDFTVIQQLNVALKRTKRHYCRKDIWKKTKSFCSC